MCLAREPGNRAAPNISRVFSPADLSPIPAAPRQVASTESPASEIGPSGLGGAEELSKKKSQKRSILDGQASWAGAFGGSRQPHERCVYEKGAFRRANGVPKGGLGAARWGLAGPSLLRAGSAGMLAIRAVSDNIHSPDFVFHPAPWSVVRAAGPAPRCGPASRPCPLRMLTTVVRDTPGTPSLRSSPRMRV
jgi:hypothetical protein